MDPGAQPVTAENTDNKVFFVEGGTGTTKYVLLRQSLSRMEAEMQCAKEFSNNGKLARIRNQHEDLLLQLKIGNVKIMSWIAAKFNSAINLWQWKTSNETCSLTYSNWANNNSVANPTHHCATWSPNGWVFVACADRHAALCEV